MDLEIRWLCLFGQWSHVLTLCIHLEPYVIQTLDHGWAMCRSPHFCKPWTLLVFLPLQENVIYIPQKGHLLFLEVSGTLALPLTGGQVGPIFAVLPQADEDLLNDINSFRPF